MSEIIILFKLIVFLSFVTAASSSVYCYSGQVILAYPNATTTPVKREKCILSSAVCLLHTYSMMIEYEQKKYNVEVIQGSCGTSMFRCNNLVCSSLQFLFNQVKDCSCCDTPECNDRLEKYYDPRNASISTRVGMSISILAVSLVLFHEFISGNFTM